MATVSDLITDSLKVLGVVGAGGSLSASDSTDGLRQVQVLLDAWNADRLCIGVETRTTYTWTASQSSRTIGASGDLVGTRPLWLARAAVIPSGQTVEIALGRPLTRQEYADIPNKAITADYFTAYHYEPTPTNGTVTVWPVPTTAPTFVVYVPTPLTSAVTLATTLAYAPGYEAALMYALAKRMAPIFRQPWKAVLEDLHDEAMSRIKSSNVQYEPIRSDAALVGGTAPRWNILTDSTRR